MTWAKLTDTFADDCSRAHLSDAAFRMHTEGLVWTMRRETGGRIDAVDLRRLFDAEDPEKAAAELVRAKFWRGPRADGSWLIVAHMSDQAEVEVLAARRRNNADRQRRWRREQAGLTSGDDEAGGRAEDASRRESQRDSGAGMSRRESRRYETRDPGLVWSGLEDLTRTEGQTEVGQDQLRSVLHGAEPGPDPAEPAGLSLPPMPAKYDPDPRGREDDPT